MLSINADILSSELATPNIPSDLKPLIFLFSSLTKKGFALEIRTNVCYNIYTGKAKGSI